MTAPWEAAGASALWANRVWMAPMVRISHLPMRLLCGMLGADGTYTEEQVAFRLRNCQRCYNPIYDTIEYWNGGTDMCTCVPWDDALEGDGGAIGEISEQGEGGRAGALGEAVVAALDNQQCTDEVTYAQDDVWREQYGVGLLPTNRGLPPQGACAEAAPPHVARSEPDGHDVYSSCDWNISALASIVLTCAAPPACCLRSALFASTRRRISPRS